MPARRAQEQIYRHLTRRSLLRTAVSGTGLLLLAACAPASTTSVSPTGAPSAPAASGSPAASPAVNAAPAVGTGATGSGVRGSTIKMLFNASADPAFVPDFAAFDHLKNDYGVNFDLQLLSGADIAIKTLVAGQVDMTMASLASGLLAAGQEQKILAITTEASAPYFSLVTTQDINTWQDLQGKAIGITATSDGSYWTTVLQLKKNGIDPSGINWVTVRGTPARVEALQAGKIDAAQLQVGGTLEVVQDPHFKVFAQPGKDYPNLLFNMFWVTADYAQAHPDLIQTMVQAEMQGHRDAQNRTQYLTTAKAVLTESPLSDDQLSQAYDIVKDMNIWDPNESRMTADNGNFASQTLADFGATDTFVDFSNWGTTKYVDAARNAIGTYSG